ncbi:MAG: hypothetical protein AAGF94_18695 [Pseudomonadota bacterium]
MTDELKRNRHGGTYVKKYLTEVYEQETGYFLKVSTLDNVLHANPLDEPSWATYDPDGNPIINTWHDHGVEHRVKGGPSSIHFHKDSDLPMTEVYLIDGQPRPEGDGPYLIRKRRDGSVWMLEYADGRVEDIDQPPPSLDLT